MPEPEQMADRLPWPPLASQLEPALARISTRAAIRARSRRRLIPAAVTLVLIAGIAAAAAPVRGAVTKFLDFGPERIELVDRLPPFLNPGPLELGRQVPFSDLKASVPYRLAEPDFTLVGRPSGVFLRGPAKTPQVAFVWAAHNHLRLLLSEAPVSGDDLRHERELGYKRLTYPPAYVRVSGRPGLWIARLHEYLVTDPDGRRRLEHGRAARNVLLWRRGSLYFRLEGSLSLTQALTIARTVTSRPPGNR